jgi:hypothetical protein
MTAQKEKISSLKKTPNGRKRKMGRGASAASTPKPGISECEQKDFAELLREARERAGRKESFPQSEITQQMLDDPEYGPLWQQMKEARERVKKYSEQ